MYSQFWWLAIASVVLVPLHPTQYHSCSRRNRLSPENSRAGENPMLPHESLSSRRNFLKLGAAIAAGVSGLSLAPQTALAQEDQAWLIGPQKGYTPEIGTLVSMMAFTRMQVLSNVKGLSQQDLNFLLDAKANTIGALLMHLAATETYYGMNSFGGIKWDSWSGEVKKKWDIPMNLAHPPRKPTKGNNSDTTPNAPHKRPEKKPPKC